MSSEASPKKVSRDLGQKGLAQNIDDTDENTSKLQPSSDFEFNVGTNMGHESSSADELFSNGVIVPTQAREGSVVPQDVKIYHPRASVASCPPRPPILFPSPTENSLEAIKAGTVSGCDVDDDASSVDSEEFQRSSSLKNEAKKSLCSLSILPRSNSIGAVPNQKKTMSKDRQNSQRRSSFSFTRTFSFSSNHPTSQKPPSKKNNAMKYGNGVQTSVNPVLNIPSSSIGIGASNLFGLGCLLPGKRDHRKHIVKAEV